MEWSRGSNFSMILSWVWFALVFALTISFQQDFDLTKKFCSFLFLILDIWSNLIILRFQFNIMSLNNRLVQRINRFGWQIIKDFFWYLKSNLLNVCIIYLYNWGLLVAFLKYFLYQFIEPNETVSTFLSRPFFATISYDLNRQYFSNNS